MTSKEITERMNKLGDWYLGAGVKIVLEWIREDKDYLDHHLSQDHKDELSVRIGEAIRDEVERCKQR